MEVTSVLNVPRQLSPEPISPASEEDLTGARIWTDEQHDQDILAEKRWKGKGKQQPAFEDEGNEETGEVGEGDRLEYPPVHEDEAETRRIEENLRRWEVAERQRRKAARESTLHHPPSSSLVGDVTRRASLLWSAKSQPRAARRSGIGLGKHAALSSRESVDVPLEDINEASPSSPNVATPTTSLEFSPENPFVTPAEVLSPFSDTTDQSTAVMSASSEPSTPSGSKQMPERPILVASNSLTARPPPPPKPLGLPPPRTPPPRIETPPPPEVETSPVQDDEGRETRWWHDWLCGCSEGTDRGGDNQAGRTNPFE